MAWIGMLNSRALIWCLCLKLCFYLVLSEASDLPVCIVGAGASGLSAAHSLEAAGRRAVIFEERETVGGKARNYYDDGQAVYLGPLVLDESSYNETMKIINQVEVPIQHYPSTDDWFYNWTTGETWPVAGSAVPQYADEVRRYALKWQEEFAPFAESIYTPGNIPEDLTVSMAEWFSNGNFPIMQFHFAHIFAEWGYGDISEIPIFYFLSIYGPNSLAGDGPSLVDYYEAFERYARLLARTEFHMGSRIKKIDRSEHGITIHYVKSDSLLSGPLQQTCSDVILAFPPTMNNLRRAGLELSSAESTVFSAVETSNYFSYAVRLDVPSLLTFKCASDPLISAPEKAGQPILAQTTYENSKIGIVYSLATTDQSVGEVMKLLLQTLSRINRDPQGPPTRPPFPVVPTDIVDFQHCPDYFPHFNATTIQAGWYEKFNSLQGQQRTYYVSGLNRVEGVEAVIRSAQYIVNTYFAV